MEQRGEELMSEIRKTGTATEYNGLTLSDLSSLINSQIDTNWKRITSIVDQLNTGLTISNYWYGYDNYYQSPLHASFKVENPEGFVATFTEYFPKYKVVGSMIGTLVRKKFDDKYYFKCICANKVDGESKVVLWDFFLEACYDALIEEELDQTWMVDPNQDEIKRLNKILC